MNDLHPGANTAAGPATAAVTIVLSSDEAEDVLAALRFYLSGLDREDADAIRRVQALRERLEATRGAAADARSL